MATFYKWINHGVIAIAPRVVYLNIEGRQRYVDRWEKVFPEADSLVEFVYPRPIFTFVRPDHYDKTYLKQFVTGDYSLMDELLQGHVVEERRFYVPFSNGRELNEDEDGPEHKFRTTVAEVIEAFQLVRKPVEVA